MENANPQQNSASRAALRPEAWSLRPGVVYLNHGSFGPSPQPVLEARSQWINALESQPMDFFVRQLDQHLAEAREQLGAFVGTAGDNLIFVDNATVGMNIVAGSVSLRPGDEVLLNDHEYGAVLRIWQRACHRAGAKMIVAPLPIPLETPEQIVERLLQCVSDRTRLVVVSHVTSPTAIVFPLEALCRELRARSVAVCVDGPHAPAMVPVAIDQLDCDYYTASCHKWLCAPFGSGFLYVHPRAQSSMETPILSWGRTPAGQAESWRDEFQWLGTRDPSAYLAIPAAINFMQSLPLEQFCRHTHALARTAREEIGRLTGLAPLTPDSEDWYGSMVAMQLPPGEAQSLMDVLWERYRIEVPVIDWNGQRLIRVSCHAYTSFEHLEYLLRALRELNIFEPSPITGT